MCITWINWLRNFRNYYADAVDPEGAVCKLAFRTALACMISIILLQILGKANLSAWGGFAAFAFVQNDIQDLVFNRLWFLLVIILVFTSLTFLGMLLGSHPWIFLASVPVTIFICAYPSCLGFQYFNAGAWALFLYILAGANPAGLSQASQIAAVFLLCGCISLTVCFFVFPMRSFQKIMLNYKRILVKIALLFHHATQKHSTQFTAQLDKLLELEEKNMNFYLQAKKTSTIQKTALINLEKLLYQTSLMTKSTLTWQKRVSSYPHYVETQLEDCKLLIETVIKKIVLQIKHRELINFSAIHSQLNHYRESLTKLRKIEAAKSQPDFAEFLDYSAYFYHYLKLLELLEESSQNITQLSDRV